MNCNFCDKKFNRKQEMQRHIRKHTGEKPFFCTFPNCHTHFSRLDNMKKHYKKHFSFSDPVYLLQSMKGFIQEKKEEEFTKSRANDTNNICKSSQDEDVSNERPEPVKATVNVCKDAPTVPNNLFFSLSYLASSVLEQGVTQQETVEIEKDLQSSNRENKFKVSQMQTKPKRKASMRSENPNEANTQEQRSIKKRKESEKKAEAIEITKGIENRSMDQIGGDTVFLPQLPSLSSILSLATFPRCRANAPTSSEMGSYDKFILNSFVPFQNKFLSS